MEEKNNGVSLSFSSKEEDPLNGSVTHEEDPPIEEVHDVGLGEWAEDELFKRYEPYWRPFPIMALPLTVRNYVTEMARSIMVDPTPG